MAEDRNLLLVHEGEGEGEVKDRGLFEFLGKGTEENKPAEEEYLAAGVQNIHIEEGYKLHGGKEKEEEKPHGFFEKEEEKHHGLLDKLHRSHSTSSSSSSSDEEEVEGEGGIKNKIKKKKALKEKIEEKEHHEEENKKHAFVPAPPVEEPVVVVEELELQEPVVPEEGKKGFLEKIKDKLPGHIKKPTEEGPAALPADVVQHSGEHVKVHEAVEGTEGKEKKGFLGKIIEKLPGYHKSTGEEGDKTPASH